MEKTPNQKIIQNDIMQYKTNKLPATLALLSIVFNCLYFCLLYGFGSPWFATWKIGFSVVLTLVTLLFTFLASEGIKNYDKKYTIFLLVIAAVTFVRIFGMPLEALKADSTVLETRYFGVDLSPALCYTFLVVWLAASVACLVASAVLGYINCLRYESHKKKLASGEVNIDVTLKEMDEEDAQKAQAAEEVAPAASEEEVKEEVQ